MSDNVKPGKGIDGNKDVGFQVKGIDREATRKMYGGKNYAPTSGSEAS
jgi:hypothetical protein